jgi:hypothetical protein
MTVTDTLFHVTALSNLTDGKLSANTNSRSRDGKEVIEIGRDV